MDSSRFDAVSRFFAQRAPERRLTRRRALAQGGAGLAAAGLAATGLTAATAAQDATPEPAAPDAEHGPTMLFVQSFQSGTIAPTEGEAGRFTVTLEHGLGQTIYFSDRPDRIVGASPTPEFLEGLGFPEDNPPNAALVMETAPGETNIAVVELFAPLYDPVNRGVSYEVAVLADWENSVELGFTAAPADLASLAPTFGAAHLFIDDCPNGDMQCIDLGNRTYIIPNEAHDGFCYSWGAAACLPCEPWFSGALGWIDAYYYWMDQCNSRFPNCEGQCVVTGYCRWSLTC